MQPNDQVKVPELSFPKGGGSIHGLNETVQSVGMTGMASLSIPLPVSAGRGFAPSLALNYSSGSGNGPFGMGWSVGLPAISRRLADGVPAYTPEDVFVGPNGEELVPELNAEKKIKTYIVEKYDGQPLSKTYEVVRFFPRIEGSFDRIERWTPVTAKQPCFWLIHGADGSVHLYGKTAAGRIADPLSSPDTRIAHWLLEESLSPTGEHIHYAYRGEDDIDLTQADTPRDRRANRYLERVRYGNKAWCKSLYLWEDDAVPDDWHFEVVFDYEKSVGSFTRPSRDTTNRSWSRRKDAFSDYAAGFEIRTHRLCRQILLFHAFKELGEVPVLIKRMLLNYDETPFVSTLKAVMYLGAGQEEKSHDLVPPTIFKYAGFTIDQRGAEAESGEKALDLAGFYPLPPLVGLDDGKHYQLVDLYGEGVPGVLYREESGWRYRAPQRDAALSVEGKHDAVTYEPWHPLPSAPLGHSHTNALYTLTDLTGNGQLDWVSTRPGQAGFFTQRPDKTWSDFTPFAAFPSEFLHPHAQLANLMGAGLSDLVLIGPKSVRLYANQREQGFAPSLEVPHSGDDALPLAGTSHQEVVAFSDVLGSGQQHLVRVRHDSVMCWPNLGRGRFGKPISWAIALSIEAKQFNPACVFLADLDGSGAADLMYVQRDRLLIFRNQSGNGFDEPKVLQFPEGLRYDALCQLSFADIDGLGCASLILTVPHPNPTHWRYDFSQGHKPYLLTSVNNNMGLCVELTYRSSAQEWLDEKAEYEKTQNHSSQSDAPPSSPPVSYLPFPVQVLHQMVHLDEVTEGRLVQQFSYRHGYYDGQAREFRGFGLVIHTDTELKEGDRTYTAPVKTKTWYHTGVAEVEGRHCLAYSRHDDKARPLQPTVFTRLDFSGQNPQEVVLTEENLSEQIRIELFRALKGSVLREEVFGLDAPEAGPYTTHESRYLVRAIQENGPNKYMVALPLLLETINCRYERTPTDPVCTQQINLEWDQYGMPVHQVSVQYPRRHDAQMPSNELHAQWWKDTKDSSQEVLWLTQTRQSWYHLDQPDAWRLGLLHQSRQDAREIKWTSQETPELSYECLQYPAEFLNDSAYPPVLLGQQEIFYVCKHQEALGNHQLLSDWHLQYSGKKFFDKLTYPNVQLDLQRIAHEYAEEEWGRPMLSGLIAYIESAELDASSLKAYAEIDEAIERVLQGRTLFDELNDAGYLYKPAVLSNADEPKLWWVRHDLCQYASEEKFQRLIRYEPSPGINQVNIKYDDYLCQAVALKDAQGLRTEAEYDYRHLLPISIKDPNENVQEARYDGLGRLIATSFYDSSTGLSPALPFLPRDYYYPSADLGTALAQPGQTSEGAAQGFAPLPPEYHHPISDLDTALIQPEQAIRNIAAVYYYDALSWKEKRGPVHSASLTCDNYPQHALLVHDLILEVPKQDIGHIATAYPYDPLIWKEERDSSNNKNLVSDNDLQDALVTQVRINIAWSDGFGRLLQTKQKAPPGLAYQRNEEGGLALNGSTPSEIYTDNRWVVSGRVEYNNKGLPIRTYHPYFVNSHLYVNDVSFPQFGYCEKHYYDPLGREVRTVTADGYLKRRTYCTWYEIEEDENDTLTETLAARQRGDAL